MTYKKTFLDTGVLIAALNEKELVYRRALQILEDLGRFFCSSSLIKLELISPNTFAKKHEKVYFYETFFQNYVFEMAELNETLVETASNLIKKYGINAIDALHIAAAIQLQCDEFITTEKSTKPMHSVKEIKIVSISS